MTPGEVERRQRRLAVLCRMLREHDLSRVAELIESFNVDEVVGFINVLRMWLI
jgi:hypothetical protein